MSKGITTASTAEYFSKNLQQIGFSSATKSLLTSCKELIDNSLDATEENGILPEIWLTIEKIGPGTIKNTDLFKIIVRDNGPGIEESYVPKVFGEFLASSKFGRGRASRGAQGLGVSSAFLWAQMTSAKGGKVLTKMKKQKKMYSCTVEVDIKNNKGVVKESKYLPPEFDHGTSVELHMDAKLQLNGEAGILTYILGTSLVNPSLTLHYKILDDEVKTIERVSQEVSRIPEAVEPHPHTMKLGEFIAHGSLYKGEKTNRWLKTAFSRIGDAELRKLIKSGINKKVLTTNIEKVSNEDKKKLYVKIQELDLLPPSTKSVRKIGEENLAKSIQRLGEVDFFSVITRKPAICDFKPVQIEIAIARLKDSRDSETSVQVLRFANLVPLQFDKKACVTTQAIESVNWKAYGLNQSRDALPQGPYVFAVSIVSPFIKFKNASKETIDASEELLQEIRLALIQAGQKLSKFVKKEKKEQDIEAKKRYIEQFSPILIDSLIRLSGIKSTKRKAIESGLKKVLGRDEIEDEKELKHHEKQVEKIIGEK